MDLVTDLATIPAILALVNLAKSLGIGGRAALVLAVILGVALNLATWAWGADPWFRYAASGLILGLSAAGLYDITKPTPAPRRAATEE